MKKIILSLAIFASFAFAEVKNVNINADILKDYQVIDVRTPTEWSQTGMIDGAIGISIQDENGNFNENFLNEIKKISSKKPIAVVCRSGGRSTKAAKILDENGYEITNLLGGMNSLLEQGYKTKKY